MQIRGTRVCTQWSGDDAAAEPGVTPARREETGTNRREIFAKRLRRDLSSQRAEAAMPIPEGLA